MGVDPNDPRPQVQIQTLSGPGVQAFRGPYVDQSLTIRNATSTSTAVNPLVPNNLGGVKVYDPISQDGVDPVNHYPDNPESTILNEPTPWQLGRDLYKNQGMVDQDFFDNQA